MTVIVLDLGVFILLGPPTVILVPPRTVTLSNLILSPCIDSQYTLFQILA
jgi:hypothetical protein